MNVNDFIYPNHKYKGSFSKPEELIFNSNVQEFSRQVGIITALNTGGNLTAKQTFTRIRKLYEQLKKSEEGLGTK